MNAFDFYVIFGASAQRDCEMVREMANWKSLSFSFTWLKTILNNN